MEKLNNVIILNILYKIPSHLDRICFVLTCKSMMNIASGTKFLSGFDHLDIICSNGKEKRPFPIFAIRAYMFYLKTFKQNIDDKPKFTHVMSSTDRIKPSIESVSIGRYQFEEPSQTMGLGIPPTVKHISFGKSFNYNSLNVGDFHHGLESVILAMDYSHPLPDHIFPSTLKYLRTGQAINFNPATVFPKSLVKLEINGFSTLPLPEGLNALEYLYVGTGFTAPLRLSSACPNLKTLVVGFNRSLGEEIASSKITKIVFGMEFNTKIIKGQLPPTLKSIKFGNAFNQPLGAGVLPLSLLKLKFHSSLYSQLFEDLHLPNSLEILNLYVTKINFPIPKAYLPKSLKKLILPLQFNQRIEVGVLSHLQSLEYLDLGDQFNQVLLKDSLPKGLNTLRISREYSIPIKISLPNKLQELYIRKNTGSIIGNEFVFPPTLKTLDLGTDREFTLGVDRIPTSVRNLGLSDGTKLGPYLGRLKLNNVWFYGLEEYEFGIRHMGGSSYLFLNKYLIGGVLDVSQTGRLDELVRDALTFIGDRSDREQASFNTCMYY